MNRNHFLRRAVPAALALTLVCLQPEATRGADTLSLAGQWGFALDRDDAGTNVQWFNQELPNKIQLPGALEAQGYGDEIGIQTPWVLTLYDHFWYLRADYAAYTNAGRVKVPFLCQPPRHYLGAAWYQRDIEVPEDWHNRRAVLFLERPHWKTTVWLDSREVGSDLSLCTPHTYDFGIVAPGRHRLTICVDNRMMLPYRPDAHSVSDSLGGAWNGIAGRIELRSTPPVWIDDVQIYPNLEKKSALVKVRIGNATGKSGSGMLFYPNQIAPAGNNDDANLAGRPIAAFGNPIAWNANGTNLDLTLPLREPEQTWDEFNPTLQRLDLELTCTLFRNVPFADRKKVVFGFRDLRVDGRRFMLNGRPVYFRGTHFGGDFPLTGYPATDVGSWRKIILTCKEWGLNHMRFHSWCPPEAAFEAADELGFYLQVECGMWNSFTPGGEMEKMLYAETRRIIRAYGNHPSFVLLSASNEAHGRWKPVLAKWVENCGFLDPRHLYTPDTGWAPMDEPGPVNNADYLVIGRIGPNRVRGESGWFGRDYGASLKGVNVPVIAHEVGQWAAYPDFDVIKKFTGFLRPGNFEIFRDSARTHGLLERNKELALASGRFQLECYKEEIEANLRTPGLAGLQLLDLHDYTGQGTALVGLLDPFWESKGYVTPDEFKKFCNQTVPLARLPQRVFTTADKFIVPVEVAHFGATALDVSAAGWQVLDRANQVAAEGRFAVTNIPIGRGFALGEVVVDPAKLPAPAQYRLRVVIGQVSHVPPDRLGVLPPFINDWNFWLFPATAPDTAPTSILVTGSWDDAEKRLLAGGKVLFRPHNADLDWWSPPLARAPVFWNAQMGPTWSRMLGLWCNTNHPALAEFPTEAHCDWQWTELLTNTRAINLDRLPPALQPIVQPIDDWNRNYRLGLVFECKVGPGKLMVCSADLEYSLESRPVARQLRNSLLDYMAGERFQPPTEVPAAAIRNLLFNTRIMRQLGATAEADGQDASAIIDGDPNTFWQSDASRTNDSKHPHYFIVHFPQPVTMTGLVLVSRQNQREHLGDIREFKLAASDNGTSWTEIMRGQLASTWDPQSIRFPRSVKASHLKLTALSGFGSDNSASLAELAVTYAGAPIADIGPGNTKYTEMPTASPDIDADTDITNRAPAPSP
jgi:beta-galactosidase